MLVPTYLNSLPLANAGGLGALGAVPGLGGLPVQGATGLQQYSNTIMTNTAGINPGLQVANLSNQLRYTYQSPSSHPSALSFPGYQVSSSQLQILPTSVATSEPSCSTPSFQTADFQTQKSDDGQNINPAQSPESVLTPSPDQKCTTPARPSSMIEDINVQYLEELQAEKDSLELSASEEILKGHAMKLLENEISQIQNGGSRSYGYKEGIKYFDIYRERPIRLTVRALVPVREHPKFNFVGKLLGPKGNSMKRLQEETMTKMAVLGRGSMRDKQKEEELRSSADPKYQHLQEDLHVEITAFAPPAEAHARIAYALTEVRKYLIPDSNDEIRQEQMREMEMISANGDTSDNLNKQTSALLLNSSLVGLGTSAVPFQIPTPQVSLAMNGSTNALPKFPCDSFITAPFMAASVDSTNANSESGGSTVENSSDQFVSTNDSSSSRPGLGKNLKSPSSCDMSKHRMSKAPYTKPNVI